MEKNAEFYHRLSRLGISPSLKFWNFSNPSWNGGWLGRNSRHQHPCICPHSATQSFGRADLYPNLASKAAARCFSLVLNHPFIDGNKRIGHTAMEVSLMVNGQELHPPVDKHTRIILDLAAGQFSRDAFLE